MTTVTESHIPQRGLFQGVIRTLIETVESFSNARAAAARFEFLNALSDQELADRGLDRDMIADRVNRRLLDN